MSPTTNPTFNVVTAIVSQKEFNSFVSKVNNMKTIHDRDVDEAVELAAHDACEVLDALFPGGDCDGITSNFQGLLAAHLRAMLQGKPYHDHRHTISLPVLVAE